MCDCLIESRDNSVLLQVTILTYITRNKLIHKLYIYYQVAGIR